jgi:hypothetical protein
VGLRPRDAAHTRGQQCRDRQVRVRSATSS